MFASKGFPTWKMVILRSVGSAQPSHTMLFVLTFILFPFSCCSLQLNWRYQNLIVHFPDGFEYIIVNKCGGLIWINNQLWLHSYPGYFHKRMKVGCHSLVHRDLEYSTGTTGYVTEINHSLFLYSLCQCQSVTYIWWKCINNTIYVFNCIYI